MARPGYKPRSNFAVPLTPESVHCLHHLSDRFAALGRPLPQYRIIEEALYRLSAEYFTKPLLPISKQILDRRYAEFFSDGGKPARDAAAQVAAHLKRKRILQQKSV